MMMMMMIMIMSMIIVINSPKPNALSGRFPVFSFITLGHFGGENGCN